MIKFSQTVVCNLVYSGNNFGLRSPFETWQDRSSIICEVVIVGVDTTAKSRGSEQPVSAHLIRLVVRDIQLEEAGVRLWEAGIAHVGHKSQLMLSEVAGVDRQAVAAPDKFEVERSLFWSESFKYAPESIDNGMICTTIWIGRDSFEGGNFDNLWTRSTNLDGSWSQVRECSNLSAKDLLHSCLDSLDLLRSLI